jgi:hypothetical protein
MWPHRKKILTNQNALFHINPALGWVCCMQWRDGSLDGGADLNASTFFRKDSILRICTQYRIEYLNTVSIGLLVLSHHCFV